MRLLALGVLLLLAVGPLVSVGAAQPKVGSSPPMQTTEPEGHSSGTVAGAVAVNVFRIPGKTLLCGLAGVTSAGLMVLTLGTQYRTVGAVFREGCGGKWLIEPGDLNRDVDPPKAIFSIEP
jgi:hypothetical protein